MLDAISQTNDNQVLLADPAAASLSVDGGLVLAGNSTLVLPHGDYFLQHLRLSNNAALLIPPGGDVRLFVLNDVVIQNNADINNPPADGSHLSIFSGADRELGGVVSLKNNTDSAISIYAPRADVVLENNAEFVGSVTGRSVRLENNGGLLVPKTAPHQPPMRC